MIIIASWWFLSHLRDPPKPTLESVIIDASCNSNDGSISIACYQGNGPYTYSWTGPNNFSLLEALLMG